MHHYLQVMGAIASLILIFMLFCAVIAAAWVVLVTVGLSVLVSGLIVGFITILIAMVVVADAVS